MKQEKESILQLWWHNNSLCHHESYLVNLLVKTRSAEMRVIRLGFRMFYPRDRNRNGVIAGSFRIGDLVLGRVTRSRRRVVFGLLGVHRT